MSRQIRCGYCYEPGHNRSGCTKVKTDAEGGNEYAQGLMKKSAVRQCSYCRGTDHNLAKCVKKYTDDRNKALMEWAGYEGAIKIIKDKKLAKGAFLFGPLTYLYEHMPVRVGTKAGRHQSAHCNFELVNFCVESLFLRRPNREDEKSMRVSCLAEAEGTHRFDTHMVIPGLFRVINEQAQKGDEGSKIWVLKNNPDYYVESRKICEDEMEVIIPASLEEINKLVNHLRTFRPLILDHKTPEEFWKANRAEKKQLKEGK